MNVVRIGEGSRLLNSILLEMRLTMTVLPSFVVRFISGAFVRMLRTENGRCFETGSSWMLVLRVVISVVSACGLTALLLCSSALLRLAVTRWTLRAFIRGNVIVWWLSVWDGG